MPIYLNVKPLDELVARTGRTMGEFARECEISPITLSRARNGHRLRPSTLRKIALGLSRIKPMKDLPPELVTATGPKGKAAS